MAVTKREHEKSRVKNGGVKVKKKRIKKGAIRWRQTGISKGALPASAFGS